MKKYAVFLFFGLVFLGCQKEDFRQKYVKWIDPETEQSRLCRSLLIDGQNIEGLFPSPLNPSILSIDNAQNSALTSTNTELFVPFLYGGTGTLTGIYVQVIGADNFWDIPVTVEQGSNSFTFGIGIPERVLQGHFQIIFSLYDDQGNISQSQNMSIGVTPVQTACSGGNVFTLSGSEGLTVQRIELGNTPGEVSISYQMYSLPDRLDILYGDEWVASTSTTILSSDGTPPPSICFDETEGYVSGTGTLTFDYDPSISQEFLIYMYGCFGQTAWDFWVTCPEEEICSNTANQTTPSWVYKEMTFEASLKGKISSGVWVNKGDYVFFGASGRAVVGENTTILDGATFYSTTTADGISGNHSEKKYADYNFGQLILSLNNNKYPAKDYTLKGQECESVFGDEWAANAIFFKGEYGDYFIAKQSGAIEFEINDSKPENNKLSYKIQIYSLTQDQHTCRNVFNRCPASRPIENNDGEYRDVSKNYLWQEKGLFDDDLELCYHGGLTDYRGKSIDIKGCQCVYDNDGNLVNENNRPSQGSFDYGYWLRSPTSMFDFSSLRLHFILDVFPHVAFLGKDGNFLYLPTPAENIY